MRISTRTFLLTFAPVALLLAGTFGAIHELVNSVLRDRLTASARAVQASISRIRTNGEKHNAGILRVVAQNAALEAGVQLLLSQQGSELARRTVEDQLAEISRSLDLDILLVSNPDGLLMAGAMRHGGQARPVDPAQPQPPKSGFYTSGGRTYQMTSVPIHQGDETLGILSVGERFDLSTFTTPMVLIREGKVLESNTSALRDASVARALGACAGKASCEVKVAGERYLSSALAGVDSANGYQLFSLLSLDRTSGPMESVLSTVFLSAAGAAMAGTFLISVFATRSIVRPVAHLIAQLRRSESSGVLPELKQERTSIYEIQELLDSFSRAGAAISEGRERLQCAYLEFIESLASALDARDPYTAGHSQRVSQYSCAIAEALDLPEEERDQIRIGALLHDIGKIGIPDAVLQKPGHLTKEEFALIKEHPSIGRRILEGIHGFEPYLDAVELHHENWDGSGYPRGLRGEETPLAARIVRVADAYDAMTSDRPYRKGMSHQAAMAELEKGSGTQVDATLVEAFKRTPVIAGRGHQDESLRTLAAAVQLGGSVSPHSKPRVRDGVQA